MNIHRSEAFKMLFMCDQLTNYQPFFCIYHFFKVSCTEQLITYGFFLPSPAMSPSFICQEDFSSVLKDLIISAACRGLSVCLSVALRNKVFQVF